MSSCLHVHKSFKILFININQKYGWVISEGNLLNDCFIVPKIYCFHRAKGSTNTNKRIKQRRWSNICTISLDRL